MAKRTIATIGGVAAATLLIAGIAWASGADDSPTSSTTPKTSTSLDDSNSQSSTDATSTSLNGQTSTSVGNNTSTSNANSSTSTTIDDNTSSTVDDRGRGGDDDSDDDNSGRGGGDDSDDDNSGRRGGDDDSDAVAAADGTHTYDVAGAGNVTISIVSGRMQLAEVQATSGWTAEIDKAEADRVKVKFRNGGSEAEFEAELEHGAIEVQVEVGT